uniref:Eukaryotic translation initiation factor 4E transporter n=1 Tax=Heterorhabditis bacteriophora TaxID=37862 RepID=A0A1I7X2Z0_HETBA
MSSQSEDEDGVHPLVSNLLGQKFIPRTGHVFRYDRDEMMRLSRVPLSVSRPENLSVDFNGEDGKFSPFKWLEHRWEVEGIKNRAPAKKLQDVLNAGAMDENAGLSPQRRGWSGGCRAPQASDDKGKEANSGGGFGIDGWNVSDGRSDREKDRLGSTGTKNWRSGANGGAEKYSVAKSNDFKLPFQKTSGTSDRNGRSSTWRSGTEAKERERSHMFSNSSGKFVQSKNYRDDRNERMPEWADGPTTMDDMIELRGFEEPAKKGKKNASNRERGAREREKEEKEKKLEAKRDRENGKMQIETQQRSVSRESSSGCATSTGSMPTALPESDAELAAILGLLDMQDDMGCMFEKPSPPKENVAATPASSGSRLSRFFKNSNQESGAPQSNHAQPSSHAQPPTGSGSVAPGTFRSSSQEDPQMSNPLLAKIFAQTPSSGGHSPQSCTVPTIGGVRGMRLEDIEKAIGSKGNEPRPESMVPGVDRSGSSFVPASVPSGSTGMPSELSQVGPIQSPLEKLLAAAGVQPAQFTGGVSDSVPSHSSRIPPSARPISLEELERTLTEQSK